MTKAFARQTKLKNIVGRSNYISDENRQEHIVLHSKKNMVHSWNDYADYEKRNRKNKEENIQGRELIIALPNELDQDYDKLKDVVEEYSFELLGENRDFEYAVHWNKNKTNLHAHIIYSERERQIREPKRYKRDYYYNYEKGKMSSKKDPDAVITKHKGDIQYDKNGEIKYTDYFSTKDTRFKSREYNDEIKEKLVKILNKHGFQSRVFDRRIELPQAKLYKGASQDYKEKVSESNQSRREYNKLIVQAVDKKIMPMTMAIIRKQNIMKLVKEENSKTKSISVRGIEIIKESIQEVRAYIRNKVEIIKDAIKPKLTPIELKIKTLEDETNQKISNLNDRIEENNTKMQNIFEEAKFLKKQREQLPSDHEELLELKYHEKMVRKYNEKNQKIRATKNELEKVESAYKQLKFYQIFKEKPLNTEHSKLKNNLESLENEIADIDIEKHKQCKQVIKTKLSKVEDKRHELSYKEKQYYNEMDRIDEFNNGYKEEIKKLKSLLDTKIFELKNPDFLENKTEIKTSINKEADYIKNKTAERNKNTREKPIFSMKEIQEKQKEINREQKEKRTQISKKPRTRGR